jgi:predicted nuclease of predicted toxin-antitoxin system
LSAIKILLDEDVWPGLAVALRKASYDAVSVNEIGRKGQSDAEQLAFASAENRAIVTHNIRDFSPMAQVYAECGAYHAGIIVAAQFDKGTLIRRTLVLLDSLTPESLANTLRFI